MASRTLSLATKRRRDRMHLHPQRDEVGVQIIERPAGRRRLPRVLAQRPRCITCGSKHWRVTASVGDDDRRLCYCKCRNGHTFTVEWS